MTDNEKISEFLKVQQILLAVASDCDEHSDEFAELQTAMSGITRTIRVIEDRQREAMQR